MLQVVKKIFEEKMFAIVWILTILSSFTVVPRFSAIDFKVLASLLNLMLIALAFEKYKFLDYIALKLLNYSHTERQLGIAIIIITALISMILTNDVALITMVPLTLLIGKRMNKPPYILVVLETIAANIGSSLTPFGNPQNLYLYNYYNIPTQEFFRILIPFVILGMLFLTLLAQNLSAQKLTIKIEKIDIEKPYLVALYGIILLLVILSIVRIIPYQLITFAVIMLFFKCDRNLYYDVDYYLLGTFVGFFLFIDNITRLEGVHSLLTQTSLQPSVLFMLAALISQGLSNVPTAILLSSITDEYRPLLLGVSVGGMGTLIASMANLISYKFYIKQYGKKQYFQYFSITNIIGLILFSVLVMLYLAY